ncbi:response regulator [Kitasatospora viridis]|uniref:DNA-binding NarL/FixJ family response regulator n=1 Tax=Kitasatospora viridis TaxID=281105 RepID=A0A561SEA6_9ACTN|nr:response regulator transcription factor [Kitasatospora viridis]TWF73175.1 DNA-binding NarL/FixJ family response regulator [Kitasatospora viridis]
MTAILIVDDQLLIRAGLAALIRAAPGLEVAGEAATGEEAVELALRTRPDVVLMDIRLPGISGITALERILTQAQGAPPKVIMLTVFDLDQYVYQALRGGASGFLLKDTEPERLLSAIALIAEGEMIFAPSVLRRLVENFASRQPATAATAATAGPAGTAGEPGAPGAGEPLGTLDRLTVREVDVLRLVGQGLPNQDIAQRLVVSVATVKTHLNRLMAKLHLASRAQAVVLAYESGLIVPGTAAGEGG